MSPLLSSTPIHDIEVVLFQGFQRQPVKRIRHQEFMAIMLTRGRLPMVMRRRGR